MSSLPYRIAVLCYLFNDRGEVLLLHRRRPPNRDLYSPIGGKLEQDVGESPTGCALREISEEAGLSLEPSDLHLTGIVSERGFGQEMHWLMFLYEATLPVRIERTEFEEGRLEWHDPEALSHLPLPETDRSVIWPLFREYRGRFFMAHIDCMGPHLRWRLEQPTEAAESGFRDTRPQD